MALQAFATETVILDSVPKAFSGYTVLAMNSIDSQAKHFAK